MITLDKIRAVLTKNIIINYCKKHLQAVFLVLFASLMPVSCLISDLLGSNWFMRFIFFLVFLPCGAVAYHQSDFLFDNVEKFIKFIIYGFCFSFILVLIVRCFR